MKIEKSEFFDPDSVPFEVLGFMEEFQDALTYKDLGFRYLDRPTRPLGSLGFQRLELTETITLKKWTQKEVRIVASPTRPKTVFSRVIVLCGRLKDRSTKPLFQRDKK
jgi:hypothetical protein